MRNWRGSSVLRVWVGLIAIQTLSYGSWKSADMDLGKEGLLKGHPAAGHSPREENVQIVKEVDCPFQRPSRSSLKILSTCRQLDGVYRYTYETQGVTRHVVVGFALERPRAESHVLLVSRPLDLSLQ